jgi:predicted transcriptional regulator
METTSYRLPQELVGDVERLADARGITKSELVREALAEYVSRQRVQLRELDRVAALDAILRELPPERPAAARRSDAPELGERSLGPEQLRARKGAARRSAR